VTGPSMYNFVEISKLLTGAGAMIMLDDPRQLAPCLIALLGDAQRCREMGAAGQQVVADNRGAKERLMALVAKNLDNAG